MAVLQSNKARTLRLTLKLVLDGYQAIRLWRLQPWALSPIRCQGIGEASPLIFGLLRCGRGGRLYWRRGAVARGECLGQRCTLRRRWGFGQIQGAALTAASNGCRTGGKDKGPD